MIRKAVACSLVSFPVAWTAACGGDAPMDEAVPADVLESASVTETERPAAGGGRTFTVDVYPFDAALSPDGSRIVIAGGETFAVFETSDGSRVIDEFEPMTVDGPMGEDVYDSVVNTWWTADGTIWGQYDGGIKGFDGDAGQPVEQVAYPGMVGVTSFDVSPDGSAVFLGHGMTDYFVIHDVRSGKTTRHERSVESASGMIGARNAGFTHDGRRLSIGYADTVRYFRVDGSEIENPVAEFAGTPFEAAVARNRGFRAVASAAGEGCWNDGVAIRCGAREIHEWDGTAPEGTSQMRPAVRTVSADASTVADVWISDDGGAVVRVVQIR